jgi:DNA-binding response OmpR family regulator
MEANPNKILIIEDDKALTRALELKLTHEGFEVASLPNGEKVIATLEKGQFSLILCDLMMPGRDGFQVLQMLKEKGIKTPVIVLTNLGQPEDEKRVRELGAIDFLIKSDTPLSKIVERIKQEFS